MILVMSIAMFEEEIGAFSRPYPAFSLAAWSLKDVM